MLMFKLMDLLCVCECAQQGNTMCGGLMLYVWSDSLLKVPVMMNGQNLMEDYRLYIVEGPVCV